MNTYRWVVPLLRIMGIYFIAETIPEIVSHGNWIFSSMRVGGAPLSMNMLTTLLAPACRIAIGCFLFLRARSIAGFVTRGAHPDGHCARCGYNMQASNLSKCPECGNEEHSNSK